MIEKASNVTRDGLACVRIVASRKFKTGDILDQDIVIVSCHVINSLQNKDIKMAAGMGEARNGGGGRRRRSSANNATSN